MPDELQNILGRLTELEKKAIQVILSPTERENLKNNIIDVWQDSIPSDATKTYFKIVWKNKDFYVPTGTPFISLTDLDTDGTLAADSDTKVASQKATKTYADTKIAKSVGTAKGDLIGFSASATPVALAVGTNGKVLTAASGEATGLIWGDASPATDLQVFDTTGTWTKPTGAIKVQVQAWGGGGGGGFAISSGSAQRGGGGGGGGYKSMFFTASDLTATVAVTVGAGGSNGTAAGVQGTAGGNSTFGAYLTAYGGGRGAGATAGGATGAGGGGGGTASAGGDATGATAGAGGGFMGGAAGSSGDGGDSNFGGGGGGDTADGGRSIYGGAGGHAGLRDDAGDSVYGGGGGAGGGDLGGGNHGVGGSSEFGGAGGDGAVDNIGGNGVAPGGGGGGAGSTGTHAWGGGEGGKGRLIITSYF